MNSVLENGFVTILLRKASASQCRDPDNPAAC